MADEISRTRRSAEDTTPSRNRSHAGQPRRRADGEQPSLPTAQLAEAPIRRPTMNWYIIHAYSGFENKVAESLRTRSQAFGFADRVGQILIPTEEVVELRNGKKVTSKRLLYPGYVLVRDGNGRRIVARRKIDAAGDWICRRRNQAGSADRR